MKTDSAGDLVETDASGATVYVTPAGKVYADEDHTTELSGVDTSTLTPVIDTSVSLHDVTVTGQKGQTLYQALGNKTIYDLILQDYPEYFTWDDTKFQNAIDMGTGDFKDTTDGNSAKQIWEQWTADRAKTSDPSTDYGKQLFGYTIWGSSKDYTINSTSSVVQAISGNQKLDDYVNKIITINLVKNTSGRIFSFIKSSIHRPIGYYENTNLTDAKATDDDANTYLVINDTSGEGGAPTVITISEGLHREAAYHYYDRAYTSNGKYDFIGLDTLQHATIFIYYPAETMESRSQAEKRGGLEDWTTLDPLVDEIQPPVNKKNGYYINGNTGGVFYIDANGTPHATVDSTGKQILPAEEKITYYQNRPVEIHYIDITDSTADTATNRLKTASSSDTDTDLQPITLAHNGTTNPDGKSTIARTGDYEYWAYNSDSHKVADTSAYTDALNTLLGEGYVLVKTDVNDEAKSNINYDAAWSNGSITPYVYTVELRRKATSVTETKQVTRTIHYFANSTSGDKLLNDSTQTLNLKADLYLDATKTYSTTPTTNDTIKVTDAQGNTYYVSANDFVNTETITNSDGTTSTLVSSDTTAVTPTWTIDTTKTNTGVTADSTANKFDFAKVDTPATITDNTTGRTDNDKGSTWTLKTSAESLTYDANGTTAPTDGYVIYQEESTPTPKTYKWTIEYQDESGNTIKDSVTVGSDYKTGDAYDVTTEGNTYYPTELTGKDGKTYELVPASTTNGSGTFADSDVTTKLVYKLKENKPTPTEKYTWTIEYQDESGNNIKNPITVGTDYAKNDPYDVTKTGTTDYPQEITKNGQTYVLEPEKTRNGSGTFNGNVTTVLVYKLKENTPNPGPDNNPGDNNGGNVTPPTPNNPGNNPTNPTQPSEPTQPTQASDKQTPQTPKTPAKKTAHKLARKTWKKNAPTRYEENYRGKAKTVTTNSSTKPAVTRVNKNTKTLPQTGEKQNNASIFGLVLAAVAGLFGLAGSRKKRN